MIALRHVSKRFDGRVALDDVSLTVEAGVTHVLLGSSGSGKSTILKIILGLVRPDTGDVRVEPAARIGYVVQEGALYPHLTVADNAILPARAAGWRLDARRAHAARPIPRTRVCLNRARQARRRSPCSSRRAPRIPSPRDHVSRQRSRSSPRAVSHGRRRATAVIA